jgi:uncharacterized protein involved in propanediol utilization
MYLLTLSDLNQTIHTNPLQEPPLVPSYLQERLQLLVKQILMGLPVSQFSTVTPSSSSGFSSSKNYRHHCFYRSENCLLTFQFKQN